MMIPRSLHWTSPTTRFADSKFPAFVSTGAAGKMNRGAHEPIDRNSFSAGKEGER
jgi:hypothetical protein